MENFEKVEQIKTQSQYFRFYITNIFYFFIFKYFTSLLMKNFSKHFFYIILIIGKNESKKENYNFWEFKRAKRLVFYF